MLIYKRQAISLDKNNSRLVLEDVVSGVEVCDIEQLILYMML